MQPDHSKKTHDDLNLAGFRALATAAGLFQLTRELVAAGHLISEAVDRVRRAMLNELPEIGPRQIAGQPDYQERLDKRLKALFAGEETLSKGVVLPPS